MPGHATQPREEEDRTPHSLVSGKWSSAPSRPLLIRTSPSTATGAAIAPSRCNHPPQNCTVPGQSWDHSCTRPPQAAASTGLVPSLQRSPGPSPALRGGPGGGSPIHSISSHAHLRNWAPAGPRAMIRLAKPSSSARFGGAGSFWGFTRRQVMRVGAAQARGGMTTRSPWCRLPRMEPPRASTMKLTRNLQRMEAGAGGCLAASRAHVAPVPRGPSTHPVCTGLATGLMLSEVSVAGLLGIRESSSNSLEGCVRQGRAPMGTGSCLGVLSLLPPLHSPNPNEAAPYHQICSPCPPHILALG